MAGDSTPEKESSFSPADFDLSQVEEQRGAQRKSEVRPLKPSWLGYLLLRKLHILR